ncbi:ABC transporter ATP-binding protein [Synechococcus sp. JA-2-3B'a(2-13)]|uniref:ABC transporter ATP-binding protein n=1 Tax=Synechococcus sp. (strain JA-2-3B'a(2-13)) TaxID=321332 RepID=UPI0000694FBF|nr:ABC transporter ATP-binding protein [Synechococcus sp. JA-2-3B'a(2-13)]ABD02648.1 ABC transporter, permease/ATP-binding protein [Synechococcus sp. JA-2-3B'a(2-13)]
MSLAASPPDTDLSRDPRPRRESDWRLLRLLWPYARRHLRLVLAALAFLPPLALADAVQPLILQRALDGPIARALEQGEAGILSDLWPYVGLLILTVLVRWLFQALEGYVSQKLGQLMTRDIRDDLFAHILALPAQFFDRTPVGKLITRITSDVEALGDVFSTGAVGIVSDLFTLGVIAVVMLSQRWDLGLLLILIVLPISAVVLELQRRFRDANFRVREELSKLNSWIQENILGITVVQLFRRERLNSEIFQTMNRRYIREVDQTILYDSALSAVLEWVSWLAVAALLWVGGQQVMSAGRGSVGGGWTGSLPLPREPLTFGSLYAFILFSQRFFNPLRQLAEKFTALQAGFTAVERIDAILSLPVAIRDPAQPRHLPPNARGEVQFEHVWFAYNPGEWVLKDLTFTIRPGEKVALVGPTGAGKSSIIRLLCRLYDVTQGSIRIDGVDIRDLPQAELHRHLGVILQDGFLFSGDIQQNITLGEKADLAAVEQVARQLNLHDFLRNLPQGYATPVRERGSNLSSGQKQLISFVRAMWRDPKILVLDEATASLDVGTEALLQSALDTLLRDRTALIIAHRLSTIRDVDRILVLQRGELKEQGSHAELMALSGLYASLYRLQDLGG